MSNKYLQGFGEVLKGLDTGDGYGSQALVTGSSFRTATVTIADTETDSAELDCGNGVLVGFMTDADIDGTSMTFKAGVTSGTTTALSNMYGAVSLTVAASESFAVEPQDFFPYRYVVFVSGAAQSGAATTITAIIRMI